MKIKANPLKAIIVSIFLVLAVPLSSSASSQYLPITLVPLTSDSDIADQLASSYTYLEPISPTQTQVTVENEGHWYGWAFNPYNSLPCEQATPQSVRIRASNSLETEGLPDWSVMVLASYDGSAISPLTPARPVVEGYSPDLSPFYVGRWSDGAEGFPPATAEWGIGIEGPMEAVWDISSLSSTDQLALGVGHDAEDGTTGLQTTVESVVVTYDTTACDPQDDPGSIPTPTSPKTGSVAIIIVATSAATAAILLTLKTAKKLKAKH